MCAFRKTHYYGKLKEMDSAIEDMMREGEEQLREAQASISTKRFDSHKRVANRLTEFRKGTISLQKRKAAGGPSWRFNPNQVNFRPVGDRSRKRPERLKKHKIKKGRESTQQVGWRVGNRVGRGGADYKA